MNTRENSGNTLITKVNSNKNVEKNQIVLSVIVNGFHKAAITLRAIERAWRSPLIVNAKSRRKAN